MKGGHRWNAGRPGWHGKTHDALSLDVRQLHREGYLAKRMRMSWQWSNGATILMETDPGFILVNYQHTARGHVTEVRQRIGLFRTTCYLGGTRPWFCAPCCGRRVAKLYLVGAPRCRICARLVYASQSEDGVDRSWRRTRNIEVRLGWRYEDYGHGQRPKGMRLATFHRLRDAWWREDEFRDDELAHFMARMVARHPHLADRWG